MKKLLSTVLMLFPLLAGAADPAFEAGASFGKGNASAGTGALKNPDTVTGAIPGYTANPPEKGYYGGVDGGDGGLANKGQAALQGNGYQRRKNEPDARHRPERTFHHNR